MQHAFLRIEASNVNLVRLFKRLTVSSGPLHKFVSSFSKGITPDIKSSIPVQSLWVIEDLMEASGRFFSNQGQLKM